MEQMTQVSDESSLQLIVFSICVFGANYTGERWEFIIAWRGVLLSQKKQFVGHGTAVLFYSPLACFNRHVCVAVLDMCASTMCNI